MTIAVDMGRKATKTNKQTKPICKRVLFATANDIITIVAMLNSFQVREARSLAGQQGYEC